MYMIAGGQKREVSHHLRRRGVSKSILRAARMTSNWNARNLWNVIALKRTWVSMGPLLIGCHVKDK